jgi:hypothetical protein
MGKLVVHNAVTVNGLEWGYKSQLDALDRHLGH